MKKFKLTINLLYKGLQVGKIWRYRFDFYHFKDGTTV